MAKVVGPYTTKKVSTLILDHILDFVILYPPMDKHLEVLGHLQV